MNIYPSNKLVQNVQEEKWRATINREKVRRRIVVQCNVAGRGLVDVVKEIQQNQEPIVASLPTGYFVEYGGQFESQQSASRMISILFVVALLGVFFVLFTLFRSTNFALQVMARTQTTPPHFRPALAAHAWSWWGALATHAGRV